MSPLTDRQITERDDRKEPHHFPMADSPAWISTSDVARLLAVSLATAKRRVDHWRAIGWPRVRRIALAHGHFGYEVERESFDAYCAGDEPA